MRVFVTGATGALGRHLVSGLVAAGHQVTGTTRTPGKAGQVRAAGAEPGVLDGLDRAAVIAAVRAAAPEVIVHEMTALAGLRSFRNPDKTFAATNELRTRGTDNLLAAAAAAGTRRVIAQGYAGPGPDHQPGSGLKTSHQMTEAAMSKMESAHMLRPRYKPRRSGCVENEKTASNAKSTIFRSGYFVVPAKRGARS